jgi:hypothetical protein
MLSVDPKLPKQSRQSYGTSGRGPDGGANGVPDGARRGQIRCQMGQTGCPMGLDGVPDESHVIGHVIFECHVIRLGWQWVILLPTLLSQR